MIYADLTRRTFRILFSKDSRFRKSEFSYENFDFHPSVKELKIGTVYELGQSYLGVFKVLYPKLGFLIAKNVISTGRVSWPLSQNFIFLLVLNSCVQNVHEHRTSVYQDRFDYSRPLSKSLVELTMIVSDSIDSLYRCCLELMI